MRPLAGAPGGQHSVPPDRGGAAGHSRQRLRSRRGQSARHVQVVDHVALSQVPDPLWRWVREPDYVALRVEKLKLLTQGAIRLGREAVQTSEVPSGWFTSDSHKEQRSIDMNSLNCFSLLKDLEELSVDAELVEDRLVEFDEIYLLSCYPSMEPA